MLQFLHVLACGVFAQYIEDGGARHATAAMQEKILRATAEFILRIGGKLYLTSGANNKCLSRMLSPDESAAVLLDSRIRVLYGLTPFELIELDVCARFACAEQLCIILFSPPANGVMRYLVLGNRKNAVHCGLFAFNHYSRVDLDTATVRALLDCTQPAEVVVSPEERASVFAPFEEAWNAAREGDAQVSQAVLV